MCVRFVKIFDFDVEKKIRFCFDCLFSTTERVWVTLLWLRRSRMTSTSHFVLVVIIIWWWRGSRTRSLHHIRIIELWPSVRIVSGLHARLVHRHLHWRWWMTSTSWIIVSHTLVVASARGWSTIGSASASAIRYWIAVRWTLSWWSSVVRVVGSWIARTVFWSWLFRSDY